MVVRSLLKRASLFLGGLTALPIVYASRNSVSRAFETIFGRKGLAGLMKNDYAVYGITIILYYILFFSIFKAAIARVKLFEGEGGTGVSKSGKLFAHAMTGIVILGIFAYVDPRRNNIFTLVSYLGTYGEFVLLIVIFILTRRMFAK